MKNKIHLTFYILILCALIHSCKKKSQRITADLSFRSVSFTTAYGADEKQYLDFMKEVDSTINSFNKTGLRDNNYLFCKHIKKLDSLNLFKLPNIYLHFGADSIMEVYVSKDEYQKIKHFRQKELYQEQKKVVLELEVIQKDSSIFFSDKIISVQKTKGKSRSNIFKRD